MSSPIHSDMVNPRDLNETTSIINTGLGPTTDRVINNIIDKINTPAVKETVNDKIIDPIKIKVMNVVRPYLYIGGIMYIVIILLLIIVIIMLARHKR